MKQVKPNFKTRIAFKANRLNSHFNIKEPIKKCHKHNIVYEIKCPNCQLTYIGESGRRLEERILEHSARDNNSHVLKLSFHNVQRNVRLKDAKIINKKHFWSTFIKKKRPLLNVQDNSIPLKLLNWKRSLVCYSNFE